MTVSGLPDDLVQQKIEDFLRQGYAPFRMNRGMDGKGSAVVATHHYFESQGLLGPISKKKSPLQDWVITQEKRCRRGVLNFLPDWNLYPPLAARKGRLGTDPVLPGFEITQTTAVLDAEGNKIKEFVQQKPAHDEDFELPPDHEIKGVSAYLDGDGKVRGKWVKTRAGFYERQSAIEAVKEAFSEHTGMSDPSLVEPPSETIADLLTAYIIGDHHLGMFAWREETGFDYDLKIGTALLQDAMRDLLRSTPMASTALILSLGDFFHADSSSNQTPASGHALDVDTRRAKVYKVGVNLMILCINLALTKHERVLVRCLPGNHDPETTPTLALALWAWFHNNPRVDVDCSASRFFFLEHGLTMLAATHNDMCKIQDLPSYAAMREPSMWGKTRFRYGLGGHVHHREKFCKEKGGMICETFQVLAPADAWHASKGFGAGRSMTAITYDKRLGERSRYTSAVPFDNLPVDPLPSEE